MSKKPNLATMFDAPIVHPDAEQNQHVDMLTNAGVDAGFAQAAPGARKSPLDEIVMVGIRMTKRQRKALKMLSADMDTSVQDAVLQGLALLRKSRGLH